MQETTGMSMPQYNLPVNHNEMMTTNTNFYATGTGMEDYRGMAPSDDYWGQSPAPQERASTVTPTKQDGITSATLGSPSSMVQDSSHTSVSEHWGQVPPQGTAGGCIDHRAEDDETMNGSRPRLDELRDKVKVSFDDKGKVFFTVG